MYNSFLEACNGLFSFGRFHYGGLGMIIGLVLIAVILFFVLRKGGISTGQRNEESPLENLQNRFVNGEINKEEYLEKKNLLEKG